MNRSSVMVQLEWPLPPSELLKTVYEKGAKDGEGEANQVLLPTNEVRHHSWTDENLRFITISA